MEQAEDLGRRETSDHRLGPGVGFFRQEIAARPVVGPAVRRAEAAGSSIPADDILGRVQPANGLFQDDKVVVLLRGRGKVVGKGSLESGWPRRPGGERLLRCQQIVSAPLVGDAHLCRTYDDLPVVEAALLQRVTKQLSGS